MTGSLLNMPLGTITLHAEACSANFRGEEKNIHYTKLSLHTIETTQIGEMCSIHKSGGSSHHQNNWLNKHFTVTSVRVSC